jgi:dTDP-4-dehydrorhamnose 3,5-epimerase
VDLSDEARPLFRIQRYERRPAIHGVEFIELTRFVEDGGSMVELLRLDSARPVGLAGFELRQINYSSVQPGAIKAFHVHREQTDVWFVRPEDRFLVLLVDVRRGSPSESARLRTVLGDGRSQLLRIPPGVAHGCRNLGQRPASLLYFTDRHFSADPRTCDEGRLPWDLVGAEVWDVARE